MSVDDLVGYVKEADIEITNALEVEQTGICSANGVNVRELPSTTSTKMGTLAYGNEVEILQADYIDGWDKILYDGSIAYVSNMFIATADRQIETPQTSPTPQRK